MSLIDTILGSYITGFVAISISILIWYFSPSPSTTTTTTKAASPPKLKLSRRAGTVASVSSSAKHEFSKETREEIVLVEGLGVEGDAHFGADEQHLYRRVGPGPYGVNLRQVHLIHEELFDELRLPVPGQEEGYEVQPGDLGENITTSGLDVLRLGEGAKLHFVNEGDELGEGEGGPVVRVTGLRNPCHQISKWKKGLQERCVVRDGERRIVERKAGIMGVVEVGGVVRRGARILVEDAVVFRELVQV